MAGANILEAVEKLEAGTIIKRSEGLEDLRRILSQAPPSSKIHKLGDHGWHKILDVLFALVQSDKSDLVGGSATAKKRAANRLETIASALRLVVSFCNTLIRHKTAFAVLDHVSSSLDSSHSRDEEFRQHIQSEYLRIFHIVVSDQAHVEHLRPKDWNRYVTFVLDTIEDSLSSAEDVDDDYDDVASTSRAMSTNGSMRSTFALRTSQSGNAKGSRARSPQYLVDLVMALRSLTSATNCPLHTKMAEIAHTVLEVLATPIQSKDVVFECLNNVLMVALTEDTELVRNVGAQVLLRIKKCWSDKVDHKSTSGQEQMLVTLLLLRQHLKPNQASVGGLDMSTVSNLGLYLADRYDSRSPHDSLQISDLVFSRSDADDLYSRQGIAPDLESASATLAWSTVALIAMLRSASHEQMISQSTEFDVENGPRKRQRKSIPLPDLVKLLMIDEDIIDSKEAQDFIFKMPSEVSDDRDGRSSWILLVLSRISKIAIAKDGRMSDCWWQAWNAASRLITSVTHSRAACFTMMTFLEAGVVESSFTSSELVDFCFLGGTRGPPSLTDGALLLFASCLRSGLLRTERQFQNFANKVLSWLGTAWSLPATKDHARNVEMAHMGRPDLLYDLFNALTERRTFSSPDSWILPPSTLYHVFLQQAENTRFVEYLSGCTQSTTEPSTTRANHDITVKTTSTSGRQLHDIVCRFLATKLEDLTNAFRDIEVSNCKDETHGRTEHMRRANLNIEMAEIVCTACAASSLLLDQTSSQYLQTPIKRSWQCVLDYLWLQRFEESAFESSAVRITRRFLTVRATHDQQQMEARRTKAELAVSLRDILAKREDSQANTNDIDLEFSNSVGDSQQSQAKSQRLNQGISRKETRFSTENRSHFVQADALLLEESLSTDISERSLLSSAMVDHVMSLPGEGFLSARAILTEFLNRSVSLTTPDAARILRRVAEVCLQDDEHERNEAALCFCLKLMQSTVHLWIDTADEDLAEVALDIYSYFIEVALGKGIASTKVLYNISLLLDSLLRLKSRYGTETLSSPRTNLLQILQQGTSALRYRIVPTISTLFEGYVLTEHGAIFDDIVDRLPTEADDTEGIAVRLYTLAKLGSLWRTCLRQAAYHIFETAANVPSATPFAFQCLKMVAKGIGLERGPGQLLHLFAPEVFYTWLEDGSINTMPFAAFGYTTLKELVEAEMEELVAQAVLRQDKRHQELLETMLGLSWSDLLRNSFARAQVYAIATDVMKHKVIEDVGPLEGSMRKLLEESAYVKLSEKHFSQAIALVVLSLSDDRGFDKLLGSSSRYKSMLHTHEIIRSRGSSSVVHPARQQPSFRVKYLMPILSKICKSSGVDVDSFWTAPLLSYVCRGILDDAKAALGPLHVASSIRKIRVAINMAGSTALRGYPLEMLLHSLRPYLTYFHCAEDTIGICWYLLEHGKEYLQSKLSFLAGLGVVIFTALSVFATSSQESTTQETQFVATMAKAKEFRSWLAKYLQDCETPELDPERATKFRTIIHHAKEVTASGNNDRNEAEGLLLYHVLIDQSVAEPLLPRNSFRTIIRALGRDFRTTTEYTDDIFHSNEGTIAAAPVLRNAFEHVEVSASFMIWAGGILGRAYTSIGPSLELSHEPERERPTAGDESSLTPNDSRCKIIDVLFDLLWSEDAAAASMAERTLSFVLSSLSKKDRQEVLTCHSGWTSLQDLIFEFSHCPAPPNDTITERAIEEVSDIRSFSSSAQWAALLAEAVIYEDAADTFLNGLIPLLNSHQSIAHKMLPMITHLVLDSQVEQQQIVHDSLTKLFNTVLNDNKVRKLAGVVLQTISYLRKCIYPGETTYAKRNAWLHIDYAKAAVAALDCDMPHRALLMLEIEQSEQSLHASRSRRSSVKAPASEINVNLEVLSRIYRSVDDADFFYGCHEEADVKSVLAKLRHEGEGSRVLAMQSALFDSSMKANGAESAYRQEGQGVVSALSLANLNALAYATQQHVGTGSVGHDDRLIRDTLLNIHQWDVSTVDKNVQHSAMLGFVIQKIETSQSHPEMRTALDTGLHSATLQLLEHSSGSSNKVSSLLDLAALSDVQRLAMATSVEDLNSAWTVSLEPTAWVNRESFDSVSTILMAREAVAAAMRRNDKASELFHAKTATLLLHELRSVRASLAVANKHDAAQFCLNRAMYLSQLQSAANEFNLSVENAIAYDIAGVLWSQGEITAPIEMLKSVQSSETLDSGALSISKAELLTDLGQKLSQARLDRPDEVTAQYLQPAIKALGKTTTGPMAGRVYHNFAAFCDEQLQDSVGKDDFDRVSKIRHRKLQEVNDLAGMYKSASKEEQKNLRTYYAKANTWFNLDDEEYRRMKANREQLLQQCLENYLLSMQACDDYGKDVLRLLSLWLGNSSVPKANASVTNHLNSVPTIKLAPFINQLSSRLTDDSDAFQKVLYDLVFRICNDHPHHSLYQLFAVAKTKGAKNDPVADSRHRVASKLAGAVHRGGKASAVWMSVHNCCLSLVKFAQEKQDKEVKTGAKIPIRNFRYGKQFEQTLQGLSHKIPPPTMKISLRPDKDYTGLPTISALEPQVSIAGGVSAPKIGTMVATDGSRHKMLLKGGNDDLRQDAIMEQVFEQVSDLLQDHRPTRQRNLGIRTYKVIPLTHNAGILEFVQNTIPLNDYLLPAHTRYYPKDFKPNSCRRAIQDAQAKKAEERVRAYRNTAQNFHPVMRFFFMEHFLDADEWFKKRLNYSRSTAAVSMLGHVLGLGDRHGHNILLDTHSGEAVHIDLGVAFEAGRVLPIPEVVPFRLTRDLVDGMGLSGVEGPFRRCCNFTLEALRKNQDAIMTILDVLRWDPLHSWSVSPLRVQRIQEQQEREAAAAASKDDKSTSAPEEANGEAILREANGNKVGGSVNEPGEADRALAVVAKKLSAGLSVEATVNELIRQATDERNLAVLYCGWAAYA
ncbi:Serine/threonine-protein kinase tel1 [Knufia obscura]|uniref:Serine/threonine-protein kinase Tel1 n=1 Tax=Knufia obscura TaxID=1635080 RepID=A0ABR0RCH2_9EURO|nr:Serine/threonine-protein kinase tel1 [Knufia obscura]